MNLPEKVENPGATDWKSLPKQPFSTGKGRESGLQAMPTSPTRKLRFGGRLSQGVRGTIESEIEVYGG